VIKPAFKDWFELLKKETKLQKFLQDGGEGKPPAEYMWKLETSLRNLGLMSVSLDLVNFC